MNDTARIYVLVDPRIDDPIQRIRYVGKTERRPETRLHHHIAAARAGRKSHCHNWIRQLLAVGLLPVMEIISTVSDKDANMAEQAEIFRFRALCAPLTNITDGGDGAPGWNPSREWRAKMSALHRGRKLLPEHRAKISGAQIGRKFSDEHRAKLSASHIGKRNSVESREKMSAARTGEKNHQFGVHHSPETCAKISSANKGKRRSPEARANLSVALRGKPKSPEHRAKISAALKGKPKSIEHCARMSAANIGKRLSPEDRAKISVARQTAWASRRMVAGKPAQ